jgi:hypothetical protein
MIDCDLPGCVRGIVHSRRPGDWGQPCMYCGGSGRISIREIARRIDENPTTLWRLTQPGRTMRRATAERLLSKLCKFVSEADKLARAERQVA